MAITIADTVLDFVHPICIDLIKMNIPASDAYTNITKNGSLNAMLPPTHKYEQHSRIIYFPSGLYLYLNSAISNIFFNI